ncbi:transaldolase [Alloiococcus sp. CFN-8]|uniref:transaldolase n=1 Tax=Alloiococcus sp. CFN-8 TaxID=3416081 RepID=UPI003CF630A6
MKLQDLKIKIFADGADAKEMFSLYKEGTVQGFTTNPSLMKKAGVTDYKAFAKEVVNSIPDMPLSFEVFSDDFETMEKEADIIGALGENVYIKIPIINSKGESSASLIKKLSNKGYKLNITAIFTVEQVRVAVDALSAGTKNIISVFAGRIADTGRDPENIVLESREICREKEGVELLWASCREIYNIVEADRLGCDIITVGNDILSKLDNFGKDLEEASLDTVKVFLKDIKALGFTIL